MDWEIHRGRLLMMMMMVRWLGICIMAQGFRLGGNFRDMLWFRVWGQMNSMEVVKIEWHLSTFGHYFGSFV